MLYPWSDPEAFISYLSYDLQDCFLQSHNSSLLKQDLRFVNSQTNQEVSNDYRDEKQKHDKKNLCGQ